MGVGCCLSLRLSLILRFFEVQRFKNQKVIVKKKIKESSRRKVTLILIYESGSVIGKKCLKIKNHYREGCVDHEKCGL